MLILQLNFNFSYLVSIELYHIEFEPYLKCNINNVRNSVLKNIGCADFILIHCQSEITLADK